MGKKRIPTGFAPVFNERGDTYAPGFDRQLTYWFWRAGWNGPRKQCLATTSIDALPAAELYYRAL